MGFKSLIFEQSIVFLFFFQSNKICEVDNLPDEWSGKKLRVAYR